MTTNNTIYEQNMAKLLEGDYIDMLKSAKHTKVINASTMALNTTLESCDGGKVIIYYTEDGKGNQFISDHREALYWISDAETYSKAMAVCDEYGLEVENSELRINIKSKNGNSEQKRLLRSMVEIFKLHSG